MFGTLGLTELIIILAIVLIIFGAGRLPQMGEGLGKALKGFKKEVHEAPPPLDTPAEVQTAPATPRPAAEGAQVVAQPQGAPAQSAGKVLEPYKPGPELTPGTTAATMAAGTAPQLAQPPRPQPAPGSSAQPVSAGQPAQPPSMEERVAQPAPPPTNVYPPLPPSARPKAPTKRQSAIVNKEAVARVQAQQAAMKAKAVQAKTSASPQDMQSLGETLGETFRTFRQAAEDVRNSVDPEMRTIQAEIDAAQKELEQSIEAAKGQPAVQEDPPKKA